jgi:hypothetical protein
MFTARSNQNATAPTRVGETPTANNWTSGAVHECDEQLRRYYEEHSDVFTILSSDGALTDGVVVITGLTALNVSHSLIQQVTFNLVDVGQTLPNTGQYIGTKLFTFPAGRINVLGCVATLQEKTTSAILGTLNAGKTGAVSLGTTVAASTTLDSTQADLLPSTAWTSGATINVGGTAVSAALAVAAQFDGTTTAKELWLNSAVVTDGDLDADATITWTGTITLTYLNLGDY